MFESHYPDVIIKYAPVMKWQTCFTQNEMLEIACGFESHLEYLTSRASASDSRRSEVCNSTPHAELDPIGWRDLICGVRSLARLSSSMVEHSVEARGTMVRFHWGPQDSVRSFGYDSSRPYGCCQDRNLRGSNPQLSSHGLVVLTVTCLFCKEKFGVRFSTGPLNIKIWWMRWILDSHARLWP